jgi:hypothetical protein
MNDKKIKHRQRAFERNVDGEEASVNMAYYSSFTADDLGLATSQTFSVTMPREVATLRRIA